MMMGILLKAYVIFSFWLKGILQKLLFGPTPPHDSFLKINVNGSFVNNDTVGAGFVVRNENGDLIYAEARHLCSLSSFEAEVKALFYGVQSCIANGSQTVFFFKVMHCFSEHSQALQEAPLAIS